MARWDDLFELFVEYKQIAFGISTYTFRIFLWYCPRVFCVSRFHNFLTSFENTFAGKELPLSLIFVGYVSFFTLDLVLKSIIFVDINLRFKLEDTDVIFVLISIIHHLSFIFKHSPFQTLFFYSIEISVVYKLQ